MKLEVKEDYTTTDGAVADTTVKLTKTGSAMVGNNKANAISGGTSWVINTLTYAAYGSSTDTWGVSISDTEANASTFGAMLVANVDGGTAGTTTANVDAMRMTIYYEPGSNKHGQLVIAEGDKFEGYTPDGRPIYSQTREAKTIQ